MSRTLFIVAATTLLACTQTIDERTLRPVVAYVDQAPIYLDDYKTELKRAALDGSDGLPSVAGERAQRRALLNDMIERKLLLREAEAKNVIVGMDEVDALLQRMRHGYKDPKSAGDCPECVFEKTLAQKGLTIADLKRELRQALMIRKYFRNHVYSRVAVTDPDIEAYLQDHPAMLSSPQKVRALQILVKTKEQADQIAREIRQGLAFEEAAIKYSLSPEGSTGGDLGYFAQGSMPAVFDDVCFSLRPGSVSKVVASDYGFHLFKVVDKQPAGDRPAEKVREEAETALRRERELKAQADKIAQLKKAASIRIEEKVLAQLN